MARWRRLLAGLVAALLARPGAATATSERRTHAGGAAGKPRALGGLSFLARDSDSAAAGETLAEAADAGFHGFNEPPSVAPLFPVTLALETKYVKPAEGVSLVVDGVMRELKLEGGVDQSGAVAWARFDDKLNTTGWTELLVETTDAALVPNTLRMYGAGYVEGLLTATRISQFYANFWQILPKDSLGSAALVNIQIMTYKEINYIKEKTNLARGVGAPEPDDPYWQHVRYLFAQLWGVRDGYNAVAQERGTRKLDLLDIFLINRHAELPELMQAYSPPALKERVNFQAEALKDESLLQRSIRRSIRGKAEAWMKHRDLDDLGATSAARDRDWENRLARHGHCSALVRLAPESRDLFIGHTTWNDYNKMTRVFKYYTFYLPGSDAATKLIAMSSYPGCVSSTDNYYMMDSGLAVMDTSLEILNSALYDRVPEFPANPKIPNFMHVMAVNRLAHTGADWADLYVSQNFGTAASQWIVVDYNMFRPAAPIQANTVRIIEQVPGISREADVSGIVKSQGYWASYNRPYFPEVRKLTGHESAEAQYGSLYSFAAAPRALIFHRFATSVKSLFDMRSIMNRNAYPSENVLPSEPGHAISARLDLDPNNHLPNGGIDAKVAGRCLFRLLQCHAISGPSHDNQPVFRWTNPDGVELFAGWPHLGLPDVWDFGWVQMTPSELMPQATDTC